MFAASILFLAVNNVLPASPPDSGVVEGQARVVLSKGTEPTEETSPKKEQVPYADYPVVVLSKDKKTEVAQVTLDREGRFRVNLPAGDYVLDVKRQGRKRLRVTAHPFTVVAGQTVRVDVEIESAIEPM
jgi:hypothetical protein